jgi:hypothetical protein
MADKKEPERRAQAEEDKSVFILRVVGVGNKQSLIVEEDGLSLFKRNAVLSPVRGILRGIPFEAHGYNSAIL